MANKTDPFAKSVHGMNPQNLVEKIIRSRIYDSQYWKEHCFALTAATLVDKAMELKHIGGMYGGNRKPSPFLCLILKMLQIQPEKEIVLEFIRNQDYRYVRCLGALYLRLIGTAVDVYQFLEPLYSDFRRIKLHISHVDEFIENLLWEERECDIILPRLIKRSVLEETDQLEPRVSILDDELEESSDSEEEGEQPAGSEKEPQPNSRDRDRSNSRSRSPKRDRDRSPDRRARDYDRRDRDRRDDRDRDRDYDRYHGSRRDDRYSDRDRDRNRDYDRRRNDTDRDRDDRRRDDHRGSRRDYDDDRYGSRRHSSNDDDYDRRRDEERKKRKRDEKADASDNSGGGGGDAEDEITKMNALRASLGLPPLQP